MGERKRGGNASLGFFLPEGKAHLLVDGLGIKQGGKYKDRQ